MPSEISYTATGEVLAWGFEIKPGRERLGHLQLLLHPSQSSATTEIRKLIPNSKLPVDVVADYLSCLRKHTIETLRRTYGIQFMNVTHVNWVLTLPAVRIFFLMEDWTVVSSLGDDVGSPCVSLLD